jgi:protein archease
MASRISSFDHTADRGIIVHADSLPELFAAAAVGMFGGMYDLEGLAPDLTRDLTVTAPDREALLVAWLQELIFWFEVEDEIYTEAQIHELDETSLHATVRGRKLGPDVVQIGAAVKAVTYHGLSLRQEAGGWEAELLFDV